MLASTSSHSPNTSATTVFRSPIREHDGLRYVVEIDLTHPFAPRQRHAFLEESAHGAEVQDWIPRRPGPQLTTEALLARQYELVTA